jgi:hypothetical protein
MMIHSAKYDVAQLNEDLSNIVFWFGCRKTEGFYTRGFYEDGVIKIHQHYTNPSEPELYVDGNKVDKSNINPSCGVGEHILKLAITIYEQGMIKR